MSYLIPQPKREQVKNDALLDYFYSVTVELSNGTTEGFRILNKILDGELLTSRELTRLGGKSVAAALMLPDPEMTFDCALPQEWVNHWGNPADYNDVIKGTVMVYGEGVHGTLFPVTVRAHQLIHERYRQS